MFLFWPDMSGCGHVSGLLVDNKYHYETVCVVGACMYILSSTVMMYGS